MRYNKATVNVVRTEFVLNQEITFTETDTYSTLEATCDHDDDISKISLCVNPPTNRCSCTPAKITIPHPKSCQSENLSVFQTADRTTLHRRRCCRLSKLWPPKAGQPQISRAGHDGGDGPESTRCEGTEPAPHAKLDTRRFVRAHRYRPAITSVSYTVCIWKVGNRPRNTCYLADKDHGTPSDMR